MIDWHSHILPAMDDGSRDVEESLALIQQQQRQGVDTVVATPHFYANEESVSAFLNRRAAAFEQLKSHLPPDAPDIRLGAEVYYYAGISRMEQLRDLRIEGTKLLLLEMPMMAWTDYMVKEITELSTKSDVILMLAHVERYFALQPKSLWEELARNGVLMQMNAGGFTSFLRKRNALSFLKKGLVQCIGSDCHDVTHRPPTIEEAYQVIQKRLGQEFVCQFNEQGALLLAQNS